MKIYTGLKQVSEATDMKPLSIASNSITKYFINASAAAMFSVTSFLNWKSISEFLSGKPPFIF